MQSIPGEKLRRRSVRYGRGKLSFVVLPGGREWLLMGKGKVWAPAPGAAWASTAAVGESALVSAPQLWDTTITAIIQVRTLTEPFNVFESDSESSLIVEFSSLEIHGPPGWPQFPVSAGQRRTRRSSSKSLSSCFQRGLQVGLIPKDQGSER